MYEASDTMENPPKFTKGDIVWVKLSSYWWPGEVINEEDLPADLLSDFKKPPLVIVKFFDEDSYEYVKNWANIFPYNCSKKNEFIKKGMAGFRSKLAHMAKFPKDIGTAEEKTNGNPNILSQPEFLPVKKINYDEIFGTPSPKKTAKGRVSLPSVKSKESNQPHITHRRFLGNDDYRAYIWIQYPGKDRQWDSDEEEIKKLNEEPEKVHTCRSCSFKTKRLEVMILHTKMHIQGVYITAKRKTKKSKGAEASDSESDNAEIKSPKPKQRKKKEIKPKPTTDVFTNLLEEWDDTDEEMEETKKKLPKTKKKAVAVDKVASDNEKEENKDDHDDQENTSSTKKATDNPDESKSSLKITQEDIKNCFDFDEEEEDDDILLPTSTGRKIPRVIPEKPKPSISELLELSEKEDESGKEKVLDGVGKTKEDQECTNSQENGTDANNKEILRLSQSFNKALDVDENIENAFKEIMEETALPALDDLAQNLKPEQNFHDARTIKFPDKGGTTLKGGTTPKSGTSKKKFVTSFEDFEAGFKKLEDDGKTKKLEDDKEVKTTGTPKRLHTLSDCTKDPRSSQRSDKNTEDTENNQMVVDVSEEKVEMVESTVNISDTPQSPTNKKLAKSSHRETIKETEILKLIASENKGATSEVTDQIDSRPDTVSRVSRRKTRHSEQNESKEQPVIEEINKDFSQEIPVDSRRKSSRRRTKQFVIEEDSEEIIEITNESEEDSFVVSAKEIVGQLDEEAKEKLAAMDLEIEALKKSLESTHGLLGDDSHELPKEVNLNQTEEVTESLTEELVETDGSKVESLEATNSTASKVLVDTVLETEAVNQNIGTSKKALKDDGLNVENEKIGHKKELRVPAKEIHSKSKRKAGTRKSLKEEGVQESNIKDSMKVAEIETEEIVQKTLEHSVATEIKEPMIEGKKRRSKRHQKDEDIDSKRMEPQETSSRLDFDEVESKTTEIAADKLTSSNVPESITILHKPKGKSRLGKHHKEETSPTTSTDGMSDDSKVPELVKESSKTAFESVVPEPTPRSRRSQSRTQTKDAEGDKTFLEEKTLQKESKSKQSVKATLDVAAPETAKLTLESPSIVEQAVLSSVDIPEQSVHKTRRGRSEKHEKEEQDISAVTEIVPKKIAEDATSELSVSESDVVPTADTKKDETSILMPEEITRQTRGSARKQSKENEHHSGIVEKHASKIVELEAKQAEESLHTSIITDVSTELTPRTRRSRTRKDVKTIAAPEEREHKDIDLESTKETQDVNPEIRVATAEGIECKNSDSEQIIFDSSVETEKHISGEKQMEESTPKTDADVSSIALKADIEISANSRSRRISTRKHMKEEEISKDISPDLIISNTELQVANSCNVVSEPVLLITDEEQSEEPFSKVKSPRHRKHLKEETKVELSLENSSLKALEPKESEGTDNAATEHVVKIDGSLNISSELIISNSDVEVSDHLTPKKRRGRSHKHLKEGEIVEPKSNLADTADTSTVVLDSKVLPTESEAAINQTSDKYTPKTKKGRSRKHAKETDISPKTVETKVKSTKGVTENIKHPEILVDTSTTKVRSDFVSTVPEESFPKTRRGRSRLQTREEEEIARAIEESLKDVENKAETLITKSVDAEPGISDSNVKKSDKSSPKSKKAKLRKYSTEKPHVPTGSQSEDNTESQNIASDLVPPVPTTESTTSTLTTLEKNSLNVEGCNADLGLTIPENTFSSELSEPPLTKKGRSRKHAKEEHILHDNNEASETCIIKQAEEIVAITSSKSTIKVAESEDTILKKTITDHVVELPEQNAPRVKKGRPRKHIKEKETFLSTSQKVKEAATAVEEPVKELVQNQHNELEPVHTELLSEVSKEPSSELKEKRSRSRKSTTEQDGPLKEPMSKVNEADGADALAVQKNQGKDIKPATIESDSKSSEEPPIKIRRGRSHKASESGEVIQIAMDENTIKDIVSEVTHTEKCTNEIQNTAFSPKDSESNLPKHANQEQNAESINRDKIPEKLSPKNKKGRSRTHSRWDQLPSNIEKGTVNFSQSAPEEENQTKVEVLVSEVADTLTVQKDQRKDIKPATIESHSKGFEEPTIKIKRGRSHKASENEEVTQTAMEENTIKDSVSEATHTKKCAGKIQNAAFSPNDSGSNLPKHAKQEQNTGFIICDKISEKHSLKNKKGRSRTHSRWDKLPSDIQEGTVNISESAPKEDNQTKADVLVSEIVGNLTNNKKTLLQDININPSITSEEHTPGTKTGRSQKHLTEERSKGTLTESADPNMKYEEHLANVQQVNRSTSVPTEEITANICANDKSKNQLETTNKHEIPSSIKEIVQKSSEADVLSVGSIISKGSKKFEIPSDVPVTKIKRRKSKHFTETPVPILETSHREETGTHIKESALSETELAENPVDKQSTQLETCILNQIDEKQTTLVEMTQASDKGNQQVISVPDVTEYKVKCDVEPALIIAEESRELDNKGMEVSEKSQLESKTTVNNAVQESIEHCDNITSESARVEIKDVSVSENDYMEVEPSVPKLHQHIEKNTEEKSLDEKTDHAKTSTDSDLIFKNKAEKNIDSHRNEIGVLASSDQGENKDTDLSSTIFPSISDSGKLDKKLTMPTKEGQTNMATVGLSAKSVMEGVNQVIELPEKHDIEPEKHEIEPENKVENDRSTEEPQFKMAVKKAEEGKNSLPNIIQKEFKKTLESSAVDEKQLSKDEKQIDSKEAKSNQVSSLEKRLEEESQIQQTTNKRRRSRKYSRHDSTLLVEQTDQEHAIHVKKSTKNEEVAIQSVRCTEKPSSPVNIELCEITQKEPDSDSGTLHKLDRPLLEKKNKGRLKKYAMIKTDKLADRALEPELVSNEPTHQKIGELDNIVPQVTEQKDLPFEDKKRCVPPKKNRWPRRGSCANKDDNKECNSTIENQIAQTMSDSVANKEVAVEEQIIEVNNDVLTDIHTITTTSKSLTDSKENNNSVQTSNITKINLPDDTTESLENSVVDFNDSEIILPPKKSNRTFNFMSDSFASNSLAFEKKTDNDNLSFPSCDDSIMSTSLRNNIEGLIKDIDSFDNSCVQDNSPGVEGEKVSTATTSKVEKVKNKLIIESPLTDVKETADISKGVPPKKKKIEFPMPNTTNLLVNNVLQSDTQKSEDKVVDSIPQPPKKKIQKLFESNQALEKIGKPNEIPLMSPLAKKKNFLFHEEEFVQRVTDASQLSDVDQIKETEKANDSDNTSLHSTTLDSSNVSTESLLSPLETKHTEVDVDKFFTLPKKRKKRKSSSHAEHSQKKERRTSTEIVDAIDEQNSKSIIRSDRELAPLQAQGEKGLLENARLSSTNESIPSTPVDDKSSTLEDNKNEMEVKLQEDDFKFCIQTNLSNLATTTAKELSAIATATLSDIKSETVVENSSQVVEEIKIETNNENLTVVKDEVIDPNVKKENIASPESIVPDGISVASEAEFVPISLNPTVMSEKDLADAQVEITTDKVISEKKPTNLGMFSMDFLETTRPSKPVSHKVKQEVTSAKVTNTLGTEFTSKAMTKEFDNRPLTAQPKAYALKSELLDILEGNSNSSTNSSGSEQKFKTSFDNYDKKTVVQGMFDFEEAIPSQIVLSNKVKPETVLMDSPKLLERLSMSNDATQLTSKKVVIQSDIKVAEGIPKAVITKMSKPAGVPKPGQKIVIKTTKAQMSAMSKPAGNKPIILSEQIIRPANVLKATKMPVQPQGVKRQYEDIEDVETAFIIPKIAKKSVEEEVISVAPEKPTARGRNSKSSGKAKILQQTIITPKGEIIQPQTTPTPKTTVSAQIQSAQSQSDDTVFDINSMPIVLSDDLLTPESIQNMPVVLSENVVSQSKPVNVKTEEKVLPTLAKKVVTNVATKQQIIFKTTQPGSTTPVLGKHTVKPRILSNAPTPTSKLPKPGTTALLATGTSADGKPTKYVLVPSTVSPAVSQVKAVKPPVVKKQPVVQSKIPNIQPNEAPSLPVGNKIMIVTNQHGQQTRVVLTPQQQKAFMQAQPGSKTKAIIKGAIPKALLESAAAGPSGVTQKAALPTVSQGATPTISSHGGLLMTVGKGVKTPVPPKKSTQKTSKPQKTILIKNQLGQTVRKIQGTDDDDLDRQVAEQLQAIKASARLQQANKSPEIINYTNRQIPISTTTSRTAVRRSYSKKVEQIKVKPTVSVSQPQPQKPAENLVPALAPLSPQPRTPQVQSQISPTLPKQPSPKKVEPPAPSTANKVMEAPVQQQAAIPTQLETKTTTSAPPTGSEKQPDRPLTQLVIQDGLGNQTTITEGQILAIPSETVDGQPQSYMLVTLDEMGNITPLNNEALLSLDPSLGLGGDLNNMVLQVDQGQGTVAALKSAEPSAAKVPVVSAAEPKKLEERLKPEPPKIPQPIKEQKPATVEQPKPQELPVAVEQQIVIGEGVLPGADAGGQQLIVTGDPIATQKFLESLSDGSTDLANILANAEGGSVLIQADGQQILIRTNTGNPPLLGISENTEGAGNPMFGTHKPNQDILAAALANTDVFPPSEPPVVHSSSVKGLPPSQLSPGGVLYPMHVGNVLETSLTLSSPIMTPLEVPSLNTKKIDDEADILNQVPKNVDLPITITDPNISQTVAQQQAISLMELSLPISESTGSADLNSPSYTYSLPALDEPVGIAQKPYNGSMPLLTEDTEVDSNSSSQLGKVKAAKGLESSQSDFSSNFGSLPMVPDTIESSREEVVKTTCFGEIGSLPMLTEDVIDDSSSSIVSKPSRSSKHIERDIVDEGLSTLGGEMCSSLSEPPPDMFDLAAITAKEEEISSDLSSIPEPEGETLSLHSENSGEIPIQPPIVANLNDLKRSGEDIHEQDEKKQKFD